MALVLLNPDQWKDGDFSSAVFSRKRLKQGAQSVCRVAHSTAAEIRRHVVGPQIAKDPSRTLVGGAVAICEDIRSITANNGLTRLFCVVDAPVINGKTGDYLGHAHLGFSEPTNVDGFWNLNDRTAALAQLTDAFRKFTVPDSLESIFQ